MTKQGVFKTTAAFSFHQTTPSALAAPPATTASARPKRHHRRAPSSSSSVCRYCVASSNPTTSVAEAASRPAALSDTFICNTIDIFQYNSNRKAASIRGKVHIQDFNRKLRTHKICHCSIAIRTSLRAPFSGPTLENGSAWSCPRPEESVDGSIKR